MNQSTCPHKWDWQKYGICTMCQQDMQNRHSANYITGEMLSRIQSISHTNDLPSRYVRMMASELLSLRNQIAQQQAELEFLLTPNPSEKQSAGEPVYQYRVKHDRIGDWGLWKNCNKTDFDIVNASLKIKNWTRETRTLYTQPPTVRPAIDDETKRMVLELCRLVKINEWIAPHNMIERAEKISKKLEAGK